MLRGKLEARKPITQPKKKKRVETEKWTFKDFRVPGEVAVESLGDEMDSDRKVSPLMR
ncbi:MAG: hypothetical protein Q9179_002607 [Wetmoreana sp. 5 TL-2023]